MFDFIHWDFIHWDFIHWGFIHWLLGFGAFSAPENSGLQDLRFVWLHGGADSLIALVDYSIPAILLYFSRQRSDWLSSRAFLPLILFLVGCGTAHLLSVWAIWHAMYELLGDMQVLIAILSALAVVRLVLILAQVAARPGLLGSVNPELSQAAIDRQQIEAALRRSEARNAALVDAIPDLLIRMARDGTYLDFKPAKNFNTIMVAQDMVGKTVYEAMPPAIADQRMYYAEQALQTNTMQCYEQQLPGSAHYEEVRVVVSGEDEVITIIRDVTDRKSIEEALRAQASKEQALNQVLQSIRHSLDLSTVFSTALSEIGKLLNIDRVTLLRYLPERQIWRVIDGYFTEPPDTRGIEIAAQDNPLSQQLQQRQIVRVDDASQCQDLLNQTLARQFPGSWLLVPLGVGASLWGCLTLIKIQRPSPWQDWEVELAAAVTDQLAIAIQQAELYQQVVALNADLERQVEVRTAELQTALDLEATLKRITDKVRDSLDEDQILQTVVDELGIALSVEGCDTGIYDLEQMTTVISHEYTASLAAAVGRTARMGDRQEIYDLLCGGKTLQFCWLTQAHSLVRDQGNYAILACPIIDNQGVLGDLWLFKLSQEAFSELEVRLVKQVANQCAIGLRQARLYRGIQKQVEALEKLNRLKDDFLSTVSHELRTPMANIRMATQMLEVSLGRSTDSASAAIDRYMQILKYECQRETVLINDLLDLTRLDADTEPLRLTSGTLQECLTPILESFCERIQRQQQTLVIDVPANLPTITTDFSYLERILRELVNNACKYTPAQERIWVSASLNAEQLQLEVRNSGVEIPDSEISRIFDRFYRIPSHDRWKHGGTGLGLALVKKLVEKLHGRIGATSNNGITAFTVWLPVSGAID